MYRLLSDLTVIECASFIAGPLCGLQLSQCGAEVIRIDPIQGGPDANRWPISAEGRSFYWEGLNKGKKSVALDLSRPEGRELALALITAPAPSSGLFVTNYPVEGFLSHARLAARRSDLITVRIMGWNDGQSAVDYTVNAAVGVPFMTGEATDANEPVNHVLPAWDIATASYAAFIMMVAERQRRAGMGGQEFRVPLSDVAISTLSHLGNVAEVSSGADRERVGNDLFGAFGRNFHCRDGRQVMVVAITPRQWTGLATALDIAAPVAALEAELNVSFAADEGARFVHRERLVPLVADAICARAYGDVTAAFESNNVCWGPYATLKDAVATDPRLVGANPIFAEIEQPSGHSYPAAGATFTAPGMPRHAATRAPLLGEHTDEVLTSLLGLSSGEIGRLHDQKLVK
ncbi:CoA transferase [Ancylobacter polymorphus]|uniref:CoA transferase n=1 Tax=Ancylobacter polymorphus TaxID=223390 RepID=A0A9E7D634_9HYPH|nr:CoA transferase [Ancylobacter polymorphus]UOK73327.1 CoA transferase [Ancylobacter polymorphus]